MRAIENMTVQLSDYSKKKREKQQDCSNKIQGLFLKGPVPEAALREVASLDKAGGKCLSVFLLLLIFNGMDKNSFKPFYVPSNCLNNWGITRQAYNRALDRLEEAGFLSITDRGKGSKTRIQLLNVKIVILGATRPFSGKA